MYARLACPPCSIRNACKERFGIEQEDLRQIIDDDLWIPNATAERLVVPEKCGEMSKKQESKVGKGEVSCRG